MGEFRFPPLLWITSSFLAGIVLAPQVRLPVVGWLTLALIAIIPAVLPARFRPSIRNFPLVAFSLLALCAGAIRYQLTVPAHTISQIDWFNDRKYDLLATGTLVDPPDYRDTYTNLRLRVQTVDTSKDRFKVSGLLLARVPANQIYQYGQNVRLRGRLQTPPEDEDFSYRDYLARQGILSYMPDAEVTILPGSSANPILAAVYSLKDRMLQNIYRLFLDPEASLLAGILLGVDSGLPERLQQAFKDTGTAHIIAISGFNIAIIAGILVLIFSRLFGRRLGAVIAVLGIAFYTFLVGADPSVVRAALMGALSLFAMQVGRRQQGLNTLGLVAALMALWNPLMLWDVGFQLSFFATLGLILYGEPFQAWTERLLGRYFPSSDAEKTAALLADVVLLTFAAQLTTLPIMAYHFQQLSLISLIVNPLILPAQPAVMVMGGLAVLVSLIAFPLGKLLALIAWPLTAYTIRMVELFDSLPHGVIYLGGFSLGFVVLFYGILFAVTFAGPQIKQFFGSLRQRFRFLTLATTLTVLFICSLLTWRLAVAAPDGKLHVTFLSVGSADAVLIQTPDGRNVLINGGPSTSALSNGLGRRLSPLDQSLDWLVLASTEEDQVAGLPRVLPRYPPKNALTAGNEGASFSSRAVIQWLDDQSVPITAAEVGQVLDLGQGAELKVIGITSRGAILLVQWNAFKALLPIGENFDTLDNSQQGAAIGAVDVLELADSGYAPLTTLAWVGNLDPGLVVISVAAGDPDGRPDKDALKALAGRSVLRTDRNGWIDISTDGNQWWVRAEK